MFEPEVEAAIERLTNDLAATRPEIREFLDELKTGSMTEAEAMAKLMNLVRDHGLDQELHRMADAAFGDLRENENGELVLHQTGPTPTVLYPTREDRPARLNPLYEAAIAERVQFDGDAPELRSGHFPEGAKAAVPVLTTSQNPVAIGVMLATASEEVGDQLRLVNQDWQKKVDAIAQIAMADGHDEETALELAERELPVPTGVPGYQAGELPVLRSVAEPTGAALAAMPMEQRQEAAFAVLSTTQGRRSSQHVIEDLVRKGLEGEGYTMGSRAPSKTSDAQVRARASWTAAISGDKALQPNFSFITVASQVLVRKLVLQLQNIAVENPMLEVSTVDTIDDRRVGWSARVVSA